MIQKNCSRQGSKYASNLITAKKKKKKKKRKETRRQIKNSLHLEGATESYMVADLLMVRS